MKIKNTEKIVALHQTVKPEGIILSSATLQGTLDDQHIKQSTTANFSVKSWMF
jgi:hypothetical protein